LVESWEKFGLNAKPQRCHEFQRWCPRGKLCEFGQWNLRGGYIHMERLGIAVVVEDGVQVQQSRRTERGALLMAR
jgi:hypothetical protein